MRKDGREGSLYMDRRQIEEGRNLEGKREEGQSKEEGEGGKEKLFASFIENNLNNF